MRLPTLDHALQIIKYIDPACCEKIIDIGVQEKTPFLIHAFPESFHHLFEPVNFYHAAIENNYRQANIQYQLHKIALSDKPGVLFLHKISGDGSGNVTHSYIHERKKTEDKRVIEIDEIDVSTLDIVSIPDIEPYKYLVKIDVDGVEEMIIEGGETFLKNASFIIIEAPLKKLLTRGQLVEELGFELFDVADHAYYYGQCSQVDLVFINKQVRKKNVKFSPWDYKSGSIDWSKWEAAKIFNYAGNNNALPDPYADDEEL